MAVLQVKRNFSLVTDEGGGSIKLNEGELLYDDDSAMDDPNYKKSMMEPSMMCSVPNDKLWYDEAGYPIVSQEILKVCVLAGQVGKLF